MPSRGFLATLDPSTEHHFVVPVKKINEGVDVSTFLMSQAYTDIMTFLMQLNHSMFPMSADSEGERTGTAAQDMPPDESLFSDTVRRLLNLLDDLEKLIEEHPPDPGPRRFGNMSFRKWHEAVESRAPAMLRAYVPIKSLSVTSEGETTPYDELESYLLGSFGSAQRLDYGTGHELSFLAFLGCIWKLGGFQKQNIEVRLEETNIVLGIIEPYLQLVRKLIETYTLEPAGSHGVWGLDDHSFLPYVFGSAQYGPLISEKDPTPMEGSHSSAPDPADVTRVTAVERLRKTNMYFGAIGFIYDVKTGPFWEHSPTLYDISGVKAGWAKINKGMIKMYNAEVLSKFPVVQHFRFGSLFSWDRDPNAEPPPSSVHSVNQPKSIQLSQTVSPTGIPTTTKQKLSTIPSVPSSSSGPANTPAPWASNPSNSSPVTAAPWAPRANNTSQLTGMTRRPFSAGSRTNEALWQTDAMRNPGASASRASASSSEETELPPAAGSMPPPTVAPWAKKPT